MPQPCLYMRPLGGHHLTPQCLQCGLDHLDSPLSVHQRRRSIRSRHSERRRPHVRQSHRAGAVPALLVAKTPLTGKHALQIKTQRAQLLLIREAADLLPPTRAQQSCKDILHHIFRISQRATAAQGVGDQNSAMTQAVRGGDTCHDDRMVRRHCQICVNSLRRIVNPV